MKLLLHPHHPHQDNHGKHHRKQAKKSHKIMKKMAKLEKQLSKYNFDSSSSEESCASDAGNNYRSRSLSKSHKRRKARPQHRRHRRRSASRDKSSSSSSSSSDSAGSSRSSSSSSSSSPSPCDRGFHRRHEHRHHHGPSAHLSRSKSFAGRANRSASPHSRAPHHHRHHPHPPHHRGRFWHQQCRRLQDSLRGYFSLLSPEDELNAREPQVPAAADQVDLMDLVSRSVSREPEVQTTSAPVQVDGDIQVIEQSAEEQGSPGGPEIDEALAENWTKILRQGLPTEAKSALLTKYSVSKNCSSLKGPKLNDEISPAAPETGLKRDSMQMQQQNQIGTGLTALGKAITDLNNKIELKEDPQVIEVLEELNEAAVIIADTHHNMTKMRQNLMQSELNKRVRQVVDNCEHDEFLYGKDFNKKIENVKGFAKYKRGHKKHEREGRWGKGEKRKQPDQDGGRRCKYFSTSHAVPKIH